MADHGFPVTRSLVKILGITGIIKERERHCRCGDGRAMTPRMLLRRDLHLKRCNHALQEKQHRNSPHTRPSTHWRWPSLAWLPGWVWCEAILLWGTFSPPQTCLPLTAQNIKAGISPLPRGAVDTHNPGHFNINTMIIHPLSYLHFFSSVLMSFTFFFRWWECSRLQMEVTPLLHWLLAGKSPEVSVLPRLQHVF